MINKSNIRKANKTFFCDSCSERIQKNQKFYKLNHESQNGLSTTSNICRYCANLFIRCKFDKEDKELKRFNIEDLEDIAIYNDVLYSYQIGISYDSDEIYRCLFLSEYKMDEDEFETEICIFNENRSRQPFFIKERRKEIKC